MGFILKKENVMKHFEKKTSRKDEPDPCPIQKHQEQKQTALESFK